MTLAAPMRPIARPFWNWLQRWVLLWERPAWSAAFALALYTLLAIDHRRLWSPTADAYFNYLADAFLHGQLHLRLLPPDLHDLALFQGRYYLYWPPLPAILLMPFEIGRAHV